MTTESASRYSYKGHLESAPRYLWLSWNICHVEPIIRMNKTLILVSMIDSGQVLGLWWLLRLETSMVARVGVY